MAKNVAEQLVDTLEKAGVKRIYAVTGDSLNEVNEAVRKSGKIKWIHVRHEETGAFAAAAEAQLNDLYVQDFGKGIDPRYHKSIFDRYFRVPGTKVQGSGLGLSISRDFVEAHGGTLTVESELGKGSRFVMRLKA